MPYETQTLFICGHRKCGTTMFLNLFDSHPELSVFPQDATVLYAYSPKWLTDEYSDLDRRKRLEQVVCNFFAENLSKECKTSGFNQDQFSQNFQSKIESVSLTDIGAIINAMLEAYSGVEGNSNVRWRVLKETSIELMATELLEIFPNSKFIQLLRDPRDNYGALKSGVDSHYGHFGEDEHMILSSLIYRARLGMMYARANIKRFGAEQYRVVRFEDLIQDNKNILGELCNFLDINFHNNLLIPTVLGQPTRGNNFDQLDFSTISDRNIGRWKQRISEEEAAIIEFHFGSLMDEFGYTPVFDKAQQMDAASTFYKWENNQYHYRDSFAK